MKNINANNIAYRKTLVDTATSYTSIWDREGRTAPVADIVIL
ncbi:MAG TPA: hypothetical protein VH500_21990 [Nitrososphaeraceae archaeon]